MLFKGLYGQHKVLKWRFYKGGPSDFHAEMNSV